MLLSGFHLENVLMGAKENTGQCTGVLFSDNDIATKLAK